MHKGFFNAIRNKWKYVARTQLGHDSGTTLCIYNMCIWPEQLCRRAPNVFIYSHNSSAIVCNHIREHLDLVSIVLGSTMY